MGTTAAKLLDDIIHQYQLTPFNEMNGPITTTRLVIASRTALFGFRYAEWDSPLFTVYSPSSQMISALTAITTTSDNFLAFTTNTGWLHLLDNKGGCLAQRQISQSPLWSIITASVRERPLLFITASDQMIYVCDTRGELLGIIETPAPVFSLAIKRIEDQTILCGGLQNRNRVCVWNLSTIIQQQDATPMATLRGGRQPAFATTFIETSDSIWLAHGCWDNRLYLYKWPPNNGRKLTSPFLQLEAAHPIYSIQSVAFKDNLYLLVSTANGDVLGWNITNGKNSDVITVARLETRVKYMKAVKLREQWYLFAGDENGRLTVAHLTDNLYFSEIVNTFTINHSGIQGVEIING